MTTAYSAAKSTSDCLVATGAETTEEMHNMENKRLAVAGPFEICSIRPPTENSSLTFRLTRNCYWNKCGFCPVYKTGLKFSRRDIGDVKNDVKKARMLNDLLDESGIGPSMDMPTVSMRLSALSAQIRKARREEGIEDRPRCRPLADSSDPRMKWFSSWFVDYPDIDDCLEHLINWRLSGSNKIFLGDADSLILKPAYIEEIMVNIKDNFPSTDRFTIYGRTRTAAAVRSHGDLLAFRRAGINRVHFGIESGSARVLALINKGETPDDHVEGSLKAAGAGLSCSFYVMPGLGGCDLSEEHAVETARVINRARPDYVRLRTLEIFEGTPLGSMRERGEFVEAGDDLIACEIRTLIETINVPVELLSDSATNLLPVYGTLPDDRESMLFIIDEYLAMDARQRLEFSLHSRLQSFTDQYGGLSDEILRAIAPAICGNRLSLKDAADEQIKSMTAFAKSRLMP